ncbi:MAG: hypothetical protein COX90_01125 [Candidatus Nealsonbacteria bacterium CG_4_10_14_0_2_um_filter_38_17]|uniref:Uncharacterized protein n=2 Tax=Candidatus Nealsoniibacteriota TaxID=1817911 RepID=A0A2M7UYQ4_9BACT|nr:MAG: hypothetical protein COX36_03350 [Candidatus Nealsonbacteria bacterium CG23_combo_of_CG06-09_8_20_14_all_38_19]PIZ89097.1 MAG: hypothetical protein COX90_01125 [Candidatus Nealsonbacteria bacterium CG_4_10_14_0_2_um_filter_38_17]
MTSWPTKKLWGKILLIAIFVFSFVAGILFNSNFISSILCLIIAICLQVIKERFQANIRGDGIKKITISNKEPIHPERGDLWVDTK